MADDLVRRGRRARWNDVSVGRSVDRILIRLLFLRMCEDRGVPLSEAQWRTIEKTLGLVPSDDQLQDSNVPDRLLANLADGFARDWPDLAAITTEALGSIYESFLAKRLTLARSGPRFEPARDRRKHAGAFYTPQYIVDYIVEETVGKLVAGKSPAEMRTMRFVDPACGGGRFLLRVYERMLEEHSRWFERHPEEREYATGDRHGKARLPFAIRRQVLAECVFGVDFDAEAVEVTKLSLILKLLEGGGEAQRPDLAEELPNLSTNIKCGNSLVAPGPDTPDGLAGFSWEQEFTEVFRSDGFDVVLGNPPYGAELSGVVRKYLGNRFDLGTSDTAALMMVHSLRALTKPGGVNGFIVPKAFTYSSSWEKVRGEMIDALTTLVDVGKVWPKVKLEQVIYVAEKGASTGTYTNRRREEERFCDVAEIQKEHSGTFGFFLNGITRAELEVGLKIRNVGSFLGEYITNTRGAMIQGDVFERAGGRRVIGGKQIQRFRIAGEKGFVSTNADLPENAFVRPGSILVQNIVAHIENPVDHIKITAAIATDKIAPQIVILDTVNQLANNSGLSSYFFLAILNSQLMNWFVYRFIFAKAIRTMHFDGPVTVRIPIPRLTSANKLVYEEVVDAVRALTSDGSCQATTVIERGLQTLYGLGPKDVAVIESAMPEMNARSATAFRP
jgi:hypothetical protein